MKILFVACYSPLINNSASIETLQYLNNLAKIHNNEIHLLTVNFPPNSIYYDEYILSMLCLLYTSDAADELLTV